MPPRKMWNLKLACVTFGPNVTEFLLRSISSRKKLVVAKHLLH